MSRTKKRVKTASCPNCHTVFADENANYCANCGQENHTHKLPVKHFFMELVESFTHFDTKFVATFKDLILKPGLVIQNFNDNKRTRYVPPIRIYAFTSFAFFLFFNFLVGSEVQGMAVKIKKMPNKAPALQTNIFGTDTKVDTLTSRELIELPSLTNELVDSTLRSKNIPTNWLNTRVIRTTARVNKGELSFTDLFEKFIKYLTYSIFILMPVFAFLLMLFYRKRNYYYSEFLVFSIYFHTLLFGVFGFLMLLISFTPLDYKLNYVAVILFFGMSIYLGMALKRVFGDSTTKTVVKTVLLSAIYTVLLFLSIVFLFIGSLIQN
jgi:Protein of unknown function (DUF3667)